MPQRVTIYHCVTYVVILRFLQRFYPNLLSPHRNENKISPGGTFETIVAVPLDRLELVDSSGARYTLNEAYKPYNVYSILDPSRLESTLICAYDKFSAQLNPNAIPSISGTIYLMESSEKFSKLIFFRHENLYDSSVFKREGDKVRLMIKDVFNQKNYFPEEESVLFNNQLTLDEKVLNMNSSSLMVDCGSIVNPAVPKCNYIFWQIFSDYANDVELLVISRLWREFKKSEAYVYLSEELSLVQCNLDFIKVALASLIRRGTIELESFLNGDVTKDFVYLAIIILFQAQEHGVTVVSIADFFSFKGIVVPQRYNKGIFSLFSNIYSNYNNGNVVPDPISFAGPVDYISVIFKSAGCPKWMESFFPTRQIAWNHKLDALAGEFPTEQKINESLELGDDDRQHFIEVKSGYSCLDTIIQNNYIRYSSNVGLINVTDEILDSMTQEFLRLRDKDRAEMENFLIDMNDYHPRIVCNPYENFPDYNFARDQKFPIRHAMPSNERFKTDDVVQMLKKDLKTNPCMKALLSDADSEYERSFGYFQVITDEMGNDSISCFERPNMTVRNHIHILNFTAFSDDTTWSDSTDLITYVIQSRNGQGFYLRDMLKGTLKHGIRGNGCHDSEFIINRSHYDFSAGLSTRPSNDTNYAHWGRTVGGAFNMEGIHYAKPWICRTLGSAMNLFCIEDSQNTFPCPYSASVLTVLHYSHIIRLMVTCDTYPITSGENNLFTSVYPFSAANCISEGTKETELLLRNLPAIRELVRFTESGIPNENHPLELRKRYVKLAGNSRLNLTVVMMSTFVVGSLLVMKGIRNLMKIQALAYNLGLKYGSVDDKMQIGVRISNLYGLFELRSGQGKHFGDIPENEPMMTLVQAYNQEAIELFYQLEFECGQFVPKKEPLPPQVETEYKVDKGKKKGKRKKRRNKGFGDSK